MTAMTRMINNYINDYYCYEYDKHNTNNYCNYDDDNHDIDLNIATIITK